MAEWGGGILDWGWFHFGHQDCPSPTPPNSYRASLFYLFPCIPTPATPPSAMLLESWMGSGGREEGQVRSPPAPSALVSSCPHCWSSTSLFVSLHPPPFSFCLYLLRILSLLMWLTLLPPLPAGGWPGGQVPAGAVNRALRFCAGLCVCCISVF